MPDALLDEDLEPVLDDDDDDGGGAPPPRPRRRRVTPVTGTLAALLVATGGFIAGVQVQKGQASSPIATAAAAAGARGPAAGGAGQGPAPTFGSVASKKGSTLYVTSPDGTTISVKTNAQSKVTRNAAASVKGIYPGDSVVVQGTKDKDGNIVATQITATSKSAAASGAGGGGFGRFGGGGGAPGGGAAAPAAGG
jgi:hypothetical protein